MQKNPSFSVLLNAHWPISQTFNLVSTLRTTHSSACVVINIYIYTLTFLTVWFYLGNIWWPFHCFIFSTLGNVLCRWRLHCHPITSWMLRTFTPSFYKHMIGDDITYHDMKTMDHELFNEWEKLLQVWVEVYVLTFNLITRETDVCIVFVFFLWEEPTSDRVIRLVVSWQWCMIHFYFFFSSL